MLKHLTCQAIKPKPPPQDAQRININEDYEVEYSRVKFGCTVGQLKAAVKDVEAELKKKNAKHARERYSRSAFGGPSTMSTILIILILLLLFGGGGSFYYGGPMIGGSVTGLIVLILIIWLLFGRR